jgi:creatinine amidohydrolase/Fe(II)-dependent formamide hydrolase-like protein
MTPRGSLLAPVAIARDIAPALEAFVAPVIPYGFTGSMDAYAGGLTVPEEPYRTWARRSWVSGGTGSRTSSS